MRKERRKGELKKEAMFRMPYTGSMPRYLGLPGPLLVAPPPPPSLPVCAFVHKGEEAWGVLLMQH